MPKISEKGRAMPASPIRKLAPFAEQAKKRGIHVYHLNIGQPDIEMIDMILSNKNTYQDLPKEKFIQKLSSAFNEFKKHGDDYLEAHSGQCNNCFTDKTVYIFIGNNSNNYMSILFDDVAGEIKDLAECSDDKAYL